MEAVATALDRLLHPIQQNLPEKLGFFCLHICIYKEAHEDPHWVVEARLANYAKSVCGIDSESGGLTSKVKTI